ncbi:MAG: hypothetical protein ACSHYF_06080 [Verrucomicrobiaceae bacterium]
MKAHLLTALLAFAWLPAFSQTSPPRDEDPKEEGAEAPENTTDELNKKRRWEANLPGGRYAVNLGNIVAISEHSYVLDGTVIVSEVTIDTTGTSLVRFYYIEPVTEDTKLDVLKRIQGRGTELRNRARERTGISIDEMAQKHYPDTTHAKTIEFRLLSRGELRALYGSVYTAWDTGKGRTFNVR